MDRKRRPWSFCHRRQKSRIEDAKNFHPHAQRIAHFRLSILKAYHKKVLEGGRSKGEGLAEIIALYNACLIMPDKVRGMPDGLSKATILGWGQSL